MNFLLNLFRKPNAYEIAVLELREAERQLLSCQAAAEYANSMTNCNLTKIRRLRKYLEEEGQARETPTVLIAVSADKRCAPGLFTKNLRGST